MVMVAMLVKYEAPILNIALTKDKRAVKVTGGERIKCAIALYCHRLRVNELGAIWLDERISAAYHMNFATVTIYRYLGLVCLLSLKELHRLGIGCKWCVFYAH
jgi:hypothetical protein